MSQPTGRLADVLARARAAVLTSQNRDVCDHNAVLTLTSRPTDLPRATVHVAPQAPEIADFCVQPQADAADTHLTAVLEGHGLSAGARRVFECLHRIGAQVARERGYRVLPDTVVFHLPAVLLAAGVGYSRRHLYRLLDELVDRELLAYGGQAQKVGDMGLYGGCLWAVKLKASDVAPHIRREEWKHEYRDFAGDIEAGRTAKALLEAMTHLQDQEKRKLAKQALQTWAVTPGRIKSPVEDVGVTSEAAGVRDVVYALGTLPALHPQQRGEHIGELGAALALALGDPHSRRWYCGLIWRAWESHTEGHGGLQVLGAALMRLEADLREGAPWQVPGAVLAVRMSRSA